MCKRGRAYKKAKRTCSSTHWATYRRERNITTTLLRQNHQTYVNEVMNGLCGSPDQDDSNRCGVKRTWSYLKMLRTEICGIPTLLTRTNHICNTDKAKAEALREQFDSVFMKENTDTHPNLAFVLLPQLEISK